MIERLDIARFQQLADAYGGVITHWPAEYRDVATRMATHREAAAILAEALALDETLDAWRVPLPTPALAARVSARGQSDIRRPWFGMRLWWTGAGFAAALAGAAAGIAATAIVAPNDSTIGSNTSFGDVANQDS
jgi:hypothetical protein